MPMMGQNGHDMHQPPGEGAPGQRMPELSGKKFEEVKKRILQDLTLEQTCVETAKSGKDLHTCFEEAKERKEQARDAAREARKERNERGEHSDKDAEHFNHFKRN